MSITYYGVAVNPSDGGATDGTSTLAVTPPASMQAGDLCVFVSFLRDGQSYAHQIVADGGQTWNALALQYGGATAIGVHWCQFDGTWDANPSKNLATTDGDEFSVALYVFRPTNTSATWAMDQAIATGTSTSTGANPHTVTASSLTTGQDSAVAFCFHGYADNDTGALNSTATSNGWAICGSDYYRNNVVNGSAHAAAYQVKDTTGSTGTCPYDWADSNSGKQGRWVTFSLYETLAANNYLKMLVHPDAANASSISGVVFESTASGITGPKIGEFTNAAFSADLTAGQAIMHVDTSAFGGAALTSGDTVVVLARNSSYTTGIVSADIIEI